MVNVMVSFFKNTVQIVGQTFQQVKPPRSFSWQMLLLLSVFSWALSLFAQADWLSHFLTNGAWLFLISGVNWALLENPVKLFGLNLGPWITGALVGLFLFGQGESINIQVVLVLWPLISSAIAVFPYFLSRDLRLVIPQTKAQQQIVLLVLINLVLSCWIQFYFSVQKWLTQYPSLLVYDFSSSAFVLTVGDVEAVPRGVLLLEQTEALIVEEINGQPWSYAERWLFQIDNNLEELREEALNRLPLAEEDHFWSLQQEVNSAGSNYELNLRAIWTGPGIQDQPYTLQETCEIRQIQPNIAGTASNSIPGTATADGNLNLNTAANNTPMTEVACSDISEVPVEPIEPTPASAPTAPPAEPTAPTSDQIPPTQPTVPPTTPVPPDAFNPTAPSDNAPAPTNGIPTNGAPTNGAPGSAAVPSTTEPMNFGAPRSTQ